MKKATKIKCLKDYNAKYQFEFDFQETRNCLEYGCDSICRCSTIENCKIKNETVDLKFIIESLYKNRKFTEFENYCIDRIFVCHKVYDVEYWDIGIRGGYYGEEIDKVTFCNGSNVDIDVEKMLSLENNTQKLFFVLNLEYGYILEDIKDEVDWEIQTIKKSKLIFGQKGHYRRVSQEIVSLYEDYNLPRGVCVQEDEKYTLIDGYHRSLACKKNKIKVICNKKCPKD